MLDMNSTEYDRLVVHSGGGGGVSQGRCGGGSTERALTDGAGGQLACYFLVRT